MSVNFELYKVFISLVENGNMKKASEELNVTVSAVSQSLKALEAQVDAKLFERQRQGLVLTQAENIFLKIFTSILKH